MELSRHTGPAHNTHCGVNMKVRREGWKLLSPATLINLTRVCKRPSHSQKKRIFGQRAAVKIRDKM